MFSSKFNSLGRIPFGVVPVVGLFLVAWPGLSQGNITSIAGNGSMGFSGDGGLATAASLNHPRGLAADSYGNVYFSDMDNRRVRRVGPDGMIATIAGNGIIGDSGDGGLAVNASLSDVAGLALDPAGNLYIADSSNRRVRKVTSGGVITTFAGNGIEGFSGDGGPATSARLGRPTALLFSAGTLYITDSTNERIRRVSIDGTITTIAGNGTLGFYGDGGLAVGASLATPLGMAMDKLGNLYFADADNNRIRRINPAGVITTVVGDGVGRFAGDQNFASSASLNIPEDLAFDNAGNLFIADAGNNRVRKVDSSGLMSTLAGTGQDGYSGDGGPANAAMVSFPWGLTTNAAGSVYIADRVNNRIRLVSGNLSDGLPSLTANSTVNGASLANIIAPGSIVTIFGAEFAGSGEVVPGAPLPTVLGGTSVTFNGIAVPLFYVSNRQINAQAPFDLPPGTIVSVQVRRGNFMSAVRPVNVASVSPGIFIVDQASGAGAVLHSSDFSLVSNESPARAGELLFVYCTGLGAVKTTVNAGDSTPSDPPAETVYAPAVSIAGLSAPVTYSGLAPGFAGLYQIKTQVPVGLPTGNRPMQITTLGVTSNIATIPVAP